MNELTIDHSYQYIMNKHILNQIPVIHELFRRKYIFHTFIHIFLIIHVQTNLKYSQHLHPKIIQVSTCIYLVVLGHVLALQIDMQPEFRNAFIILSTLFCSMDMQNLDFNEKQILTCFISIFYFEPVYFSENIIKPILHILI